MLLSTRVTLNRTVGESARPGLARFGSAAVACLGLLFGGSAALSAPVPGKTIGLVVTSWLVGSFQSADGKQECPDGFQFNNQQNFEAQFPTTEERNRLAQDVVHLGRAASDGAPLKPEQWYQNRGPEGVSVVFSPAVVKDPLPLRLVKSKVALGLDLDGSQNGGASAATCKHEEFESPEGVKGIDNQLYRVMGCNSAWRRGGFNEGFNAPIFAADPTDRLLIEIADVDDSVNDDHVVVNVYKGMDPLQVDSKGNPIPWLVNRIDVRLPRYMSSTTGRIVNGVLETEPVDTRFAALLTLFPTERFIQGMRLRLRLEDESASGVMAGYENVQAFYWMYAKSYGVASNGVSPWSPPSVYAALHQYADGYPDAQGACTGISAAYDLKAVRAFIVRPAADDPVSVDAALRAAQNTLTR